MLALAHYEASLCPLCGRPLSVCTDPANEGKFEVGLPTRCHAKTADVKNADALRKYPHHEALLTGVRLAAE